MTGGYLTGMTYPELVLLHTRLMTDCARMTSRCWGLAGDPAAWDINADAGRDVLECAHEVLEEMERRTAGHDC